ncbi:ribosomal protein S5 domain 2-type protein [Gamsiella multidivaricata]|uniref:ribosomal protein S5 domain 2-type protein n=1 Tax=Gamsiella multidivaricata TaxID=101098 RepID=UPI00221FFB3C|nr:ribosomal protein S5 domain 2-type protein [Gamsiella multidivaricata]KAI7825686.1 ribosomal protein S5 domain 2-type protein [Gamsiella multidivaricata]
MPSYFTSAPGKVILFGEHAVVYGKVATAGSLGLRSYCLIQDRTDGAISVNLPDVQLERTWRSTDVPRQARGANVDSPLLYSYGIGYPYPPATMDNTVLDQLATFVDLAAYTNRSQATIALLYLHSYLTSDEIVIQGYDFSVRSNLPVGAGLGSSASYCVCLATALLKLNGHLDTGLLDAAAQRDLINQWAFQAEKVIHGNPSGIDNTVSTLGGAVMFKKGEKIEPLPGTNKASLSLIRFRFQSLRFLLTNTRVPRETQVQVANVRKLHDKFPSVVNPVLDAIHEISVSCKEMFGQDGLDRERLLSRFGELVDVNHGLLAALGVSHPALEKVREISAKIGLKSKLTGAGGGGCALTLIRDDVSPETIAVVKQLLEAEGFQCMETQVGGPGAGVLTLDQATPVTEFLAHDRAYFDATQNWAYFA